MLRPVKDLQGYAIHATDGDIGQVDEFYFDDERWTIRYLVVATGNWLSGRKVLISPIAIGKADWVAEKLNLALTKGQVENSPDIDTHKPVSRQREIEYFNYYGYPYYWYGGGLWGADAYPSALTAAGALGAESAMERETVPPEAQGDPHLRSTSEVIGYYIEAADGELGHVEDLIVDDESWAIRYIVVDTANWWLGKKVLVAPQWIERVSWAESKVYVNLPREAIKNSPEYDPLALINREYEERLYGHYGRPRYW